MSDRKHMSLGKQIEHEIALLFTLKENKRSWQIPFLAAMCVGTPLLVGLYFGSLQSGLIGAISGLVIIYLPSSGSITNRIITILICAFGFISAFTFGQLFSFNPIASTIAFGLFALVVHWIVLYYKSAPPGSFFFILIASISICQPFSLEDLPTKVGLTALGTIFSCVLALVYLFSIAKKIPSGSPTPIVPVLTKNSYADIWEAVIMGLFMATSLGLGYLLELKNPYWIPISAGAVMQGASLYHIRQRTFQRILGTFIGLGLCWIILSLVKTPLLLCLSIMVLQLIIEMLITRHYALAVIFITPLTILLAEAANPMIADPNTLLSLRFWEIAIGSILGAIGGWMLYKEKIRFASIRGIEKISSGLIKR